ncbi:MAG: hypothetical protein Q8Q04_03805 [archaeon]|nr:hypothetical protein [archaeon]
MEAENPASTVIISPNAGEKVMEVKKGNKKSLVLTIIIVALLIVGAVYFVANVADNSQSNLSGTENSVTNNPEELISSSVTDSENDVELGDLI